MFVTMSIISLVRVSQDIGMLMFINNITFSPTVSDLDKIADKKRKLGRQKQYVLLLVYYCFSLYSD